MEELKDRGVSVKEFYLVRTLYPHKEKGGSRQGPAEGSLSTNDAHAQCLCFFFFLTVSQEEEVPKTSLGKSCNAMVTSIPSA